ncbi:MAG: c-type cytochrome [Acidimicrobiales bacterium]|nr:c-type cytochrome [Acidimicrobiales bacterium]
MNRRSTGALATSVATVTIALLLLAACGGDEAAPADPVDPIAVRGASIATASGCAACHGANWEGGIAPTWIGLAGSKVVLDDGTTVIADTAYLTRSITDPSAQKVAGAAIVMPDNMLTDAQVEQVVYFIESLARPGGG